MNSSRSEVLSLYRKLRRFGLNWKQKDVIGGGRKSYQAVQDQELEEERMFILTEARRQIEANRSEQDPDKIHQLIQLAYQRMELAQHYGIPYERPVHLPTGFVRLKQKKIKLDTLNANLK